MSYVCFEKTFEISIPYDADCVHELGKIMGKTFHRKGRVFEFPSTQIFDVINAVKPYFPEVARKLEHSRR